MGIPVPVGREFLATAKGSRWKPVRCEKCALEWAYPVKRKGVGSGNSPAFVGGDEAAKHASEVAESELVRALDSAVDPVPCPGCGHYQKAMVELLRIERYGLFTVGGGMLLVGALVLAAKTMFEFSGAAALAGLALLIAGATLKARFNPNATPLLKPPEPRPTVSRSEWTRLQLESGKDSVPAVWWQDLDEPVA